MWLKCKTRDIIIHNSKLDVAEFVCVTLTCSSLIQISLERFWGQNLPERKERERTMSVKDPLIQTRFPNNKYFKNSQRSKTAINPGQGQHLPQHKYLLNRVRGFLVQQILTENFPCRSHFVKTKTAGKSLSQSKFKIMCWRLLWPLEIRISSRLSDMYTVYSVWKSRVRKYFLTSAHISCLWKVAALFSLHLPSLSAPQLK